MSERSPFARDTDTPAVSTLTVGRSKGGAKINRKFTSQRLNFRALLPLSLSCDFLSFCLPIIIQLQLNILIWIPTNSGPFTLLHPHAMSQCVGLLSLDDLKAVPVTARYTLSADAASLYHMLGLSGRTEEQVRGGHQRSMRATPCSPLNRLFSYAIPSLSSFRSQ